MVTILAIYIILITHFFFFFASRTKSRFCWLMNQFSQMIHHIVPGRWFLFWISFLWVHRHPFLRPSDNNRPSLGVHGTTTLCMVTSRCPVPASSEPASRYSIPGVRGKDTVNLFLLLLNMQFKQSILCYHSWCSSYQGSGLDKCSHVWSRTEDRCWWCPRRAPFGPSERPYELWLEPLHGFLCHERTAHWPW